MTLPLYPPSSASAGAPSVPVRYRLRRYGRASGLAPGAFLAAYKALWVYKGGGSGSNSDVTAAVDDAVADGCDVISMSLGSDYYSYFDDISRLNAAKVWDENGITWAMGWRLFLSKSHGPCCCTRRNRACRCTHTHAHTHTHTRMHARTHARTHARVHSLKRRLP